MTARGGPGRWLSTAEAAARLGVKRETLYAYVSRGMLERRPAADGRSSTFAADQVEALAQRARRGGRARGLEVVVSTGLTLLTEDGLWFRGRDACHLARTVGFESVAEWLWSGREEALAVRPSWPAPAGPSAGPGAATEPGQAADPVDRCRVAVAVLAAGDELRYDLGEQAVTAAGRRMIAAMVASLAPPPAAVAYGGAAAGSSEPAAGPSEPAGGPSPPDSVAGRLWQRLTSRPADGAAVAALDAALVLLADHELAASTFAVRIAASVRADPYSVVSTGLGVVAGGLHGAASREVVALLDEVGRSDSAARVVGDRLRRGQRLAGIGHPVYVGADPRAETLLDLLDRVSVDPHRRGVVDEVLAVVRARLPPPVNIDFALGALGYLTGMTADGGEAVFAVARTAGWLAHALEEYGEAPLRFRPRAVYTGPRP